MNDKGDRIITTVILTMMMIVDSLQVMPILVFLSSVISILYYIGFMQWLICKVRKWEDRVNGGSEMQLIHTIYFTFQ